MMQPTRWVIDTIKEHEGCQLKSYLDAGGLPTIGYGHTKRVYHPGMFITQEQADDLLCADILDASLAVTHWTGGMELTQGQFDACVDFVYNLGSAAFAGSTLLKKIKSMDYAGASTQFELWNHCEGRVLNGLTKRRQDEKERFLS